MEREGVLRFEAVHRDGTVEGRVHPEEVAALQRWHRVLGRLGMVGRVPGRYGGASFGNLSVRLRAGEEKGSCSFAITGTQRMGTRRLSVADLCVVERADPEAGRVWSVGPVLPSSESMTHAAVYAARPTVGGVIHVHAPPIWRAARSLGLATTPPGVPYGTRAMATSMAQTCSGFPPEEPGAVAMLGHEDGIVAFGPDLTAAGSLLLALWRRAPS